MDNSDTLDVRLAFWFLMLIVFLAVVTSCSAQELPEIAPTFEQPCDPVGPHCQIFYSVRGCDKNLQVDSTIVRLFDVFDNCELQRKIEQAEKNYRERLENWKKYHEGDAGMLEVIKKYHTRIFPCGDV